MSSVEYKSFYPKTRSQWRKWLAKNHKSSPGIWMIYYKTQTGKRAFSMAVAVEEALCFGWIDSVARKLDDERTLQKFTPRKPKSIWSKLNKARVEKLIINHQMTDAGLAAMEKAKKNGSWDTLNESDYHADTNSLPPDLEKALNRNKAALENFNAFPASYRRRFLFWIDSAKQSETRKQRVKQTFLMAKANKKPGIKGFQL